MRNFHGSVMKMLVVAAGASTMLMALAPSAGLALTLPSARTCDGEVATIVSAAATITGTPGVDVIVATGTTGQTIRSGAGDDIICGSSGPDRIFAGDGNDTVLAGNGNDAIDGWNGFDTIDGGFGNDSVAGGSGDDVITGGPGTDTVSGNTGDDRIRGGGASDTLVGGRGSDALDGGPAPDVIDPGAGSNSCGSDSSDSMRGPCAIDTTGPAISDVVVPDVVTAGTTMTFTWRVTDSGGVSNTNMRFGGDSGYVTSWCDFVVVADLVTGDAFDGTYRASCSLPDNAVNSTYTVFLMASDMFGNSSTWDTSTQFEFSVTGGSTDASPPAVSVLGATVEGDSVIVRWRATDPAGVAGQSAWMAHNTYSFASIEGSYFAYNAPFLVGGDAVDGRYEQRLDRRSIAPDGTYTVWLTTIDTLGNRSFSQTAITVVL